MNMYSISENQDMRCISEEKSKVRDLLRKIRFTVSLEQYEIWSRDACIHIFESIQTCDTASSPHIMVYCAKFPELDTNPLIDLLFSKNIPVVVPIIQKEDVSLRFSYLKTRDVLVSSTFQVPEPIGAEIPARPEDITIGIIPMLGFGRDGSRIGYGAGYYDRFLQSHPHVYKIGVAFSCQECDKIPVTADDIKMDLIITERGIVYGDVSLLTGDKLAI